MKIVNITVFKKSEFEYLGQKDLIKHFKLMKVNIKK